MGDEQHPKTLVLAPRINPADDCVLLVEWRIPDGTRVHRGDVLAVIETSKAALEVTADAEGYLRHQAAEGTEIPIGSTLAVLCDLPRPDRNPDENSPAVIRPDGKPVPPAPRFSRAALRVLEGRSLDPGMFPGKGLVTAADVRAILEEPTGQPGLVAVGRTPDEASDVSDLITRLTRYHVVMKVTLAQLLAREGASRNPVVLAPEARHAALAPGSLLAHLSRSKDLQWLIRLGFLIPPLIHPAARIAPEATIGGGSHVLDLASIGKSARLGLGCIVSTGSSIEEGCSLGDNVRVLAGAVVSAGARVESGSILGSESVICPGIRVGEAAVVGHRCRVEHDLAPGSVFF